MQVFERIKDEVRKHSKKMFAKKLGNKNHVYLRGIGTKELYKVIDEIVEEYNNGWIPVGERMPENATHKGALCPKYWVMTKYGPTVGWYNPDRESWFILAWFMTGRCIEQEIDFDKSCVPKVIEFPVDTENVIAWQPLPPNYQPKGE